MITEIEQQTLASGGGRLPDSVAESSEDNKKLVSYFRNLPEISGFMVNPELDKLLIERSGTGVNDRYLEDYVLMTKKGLYSFDKTIPCNFLDPYYHLVASPIIPLTVGDLPNEIIEIFMKTQCLDGMKASLDISKIQ